MAAATASAGRQPEGGDKPEPNGQLGTDEPLAAWERELLTGAKASTGGGEAASADTA